MLTIFYNMLNAKKRFHSIAYMLERVENGSKAQINTDTMFGNINASFTDLFQALETTKQFKNGRLVIGPMYREMFETLRSQYAELRKDKERPISDYREIMKKMENFVEFIEAFISFDYVGYYEFNPEFAAWERAKGFISDLALMTVCNAIDRDETFNMVHVNSHGYDSSWNIKAHKPNANLYVIDSFENTNIPSNKMAAFTRYLGGGIKGVKADSSAFDVAVVAPAVSLEYVKDDVYFVSKEKVHFDRVSNWLRRDGLMVYCIPVCCIGKTIATALAKMLRDVRMFIDPGQKGATTVVIMGLKNGPMDRELDPKLYAALRHLCQDPEIINEYALGDYKYSLPKGTVKISKFRGGSLNDIQMMALYESSSAMGDFWKKQQVDKLSDKKSRPLLPFSVGQLGLVLTSGCLDGVVEEANGCSHAVKGRVVKVTDHDSHLDPDSNQMEVSTVTSNRVEISMFLPDGTYKCLA